MDYIYGQLNERVSVKPYSGLKTSTAKVTVNNSTGTISVDVLKTSDNFKIITITKNSTTYTSDTEFDNVISELNDGKFIIYRLFENIDSTKSYSNSYKITFNDSEIHIFFHEDIELIHTLEGVDVASKESSPVVGEGTVDNMIIV